MLREIKILNKKNKKKKQNKFQNLNRHKTYSNKNSYKFKLIDKVTFAIGIALIFFIAIVRPF